MSEKTKEMDIVRMMLMLAPRLRNARSIGIIATGSDSASCADRSGKLSAKSILNTRSTAVATALYSEEHKSEND